jgi:hypothetical protein
VVSVTKLRPSYRLCDSVLVIFQGESRRWFSIGDVGSREQHHETPAAIHKSLVAVADQTVFNRHAALGLLHGKHMFTSS